jgi:hypothetical protein
MMDTLTLRLANVSWIPISDRQVFVLRAVWLSRGETRAPPGTSNDNELQRVPMLDWPATLFDDEVFC